jgi:hypothetical protein
VRGLTKELGRGEAGAALLVLVWLARTAFFTSRDRPAWLSAPPAGRLSMGGGIFASFSISVNLRFSGCSSCSQSFPVKQLRLRHQARLDDSAHLIVIPGSPIALARQLADL